MLILNFDVITKIKQNSRYSHNKFNMLSQAGKQYQRSKRIKPLQKAQRQRVYKSSSVKVKRSQPDPKFSPFNTVSRQSRDSYLLRVTNEPNPNAIYQPKFSLTLPLGRRSTIDQAKFERIIGDPITEDFSVQFASKNAKCIKSHQDSKHRPLTVSQTQNWRKTLQHFDFSKQQDCKRLSLPKKLSIQQSTSEDFMKTLSTITESNFNNYKRFNLKLREHQVHDFSLTPAHQYLKQVETKERSPEYDILAVNQSFIHKSMPKTKGEKRFYLYKERIVTRKDRADKDWHTFLQYDTQSPTKNQTIEFDSLVSRRQNDVHSQYPIRLSLTRPLRVKN